MKKHKGNLEIITGMILFTLAAIGAFVSGMASSRELKMRQQAINSQEGFYAGELTAVSAYYNNKAAPLPDGKVSITNFKNTDH